MLVEQANGTGAKPTQQQLEDAAATVLGAHMICLKRQTSTDSNRSKACFKSITAQPRDLSIDTNAAF